MFCVVCWSILSPGSEARRVTPDRFSSLSFIMTSRLYLVWEGVNNFLLCTVMSQLRERRGGNAVTGASFLG